MDRASIAALLTLAGGTLLPAWLAGLSTPPPQTRAIHVEAYRYGFSPSRIHANRGDRLRLTFSTRDTGQSFFFQDYDLQVNITPGSPLVEVQRLSRPGDPPEIVEAVEIVAGLPGPLGWLVSKSHFRNHTYNGPLHGTERGDLIVGPNRLLYGALGLLAALPLAGLLRFGRPKGLPNAGRARLQQVGQASAGRAPSYSLSNPAPPAAPLAYGGDRRLNLFALFPRLKGAVRAPAFPLNLALPMLAVFWFLVLAGLFGTKVAGRNAGPMIVWALWLPALILVLVPLGGRVWCTVCPLPLIGEWLQRARRRTATPPAWPAWLSNAWPRVILFLLLGTFSTAIVALPPATSWLLIALVLLAVFTSYWAESRVFCRYLCPINSYIGLYAATGRVMVRSVSGETCSNCKERFCFTGSNKGWGCPYGLVAGEVDRNHDCGACLECVKTCAYDNVAVFWRRAGWDTALASYGEAWQAIVMFALACLYCVVNLGAWDRIRDWTDLVDKRNWGAFSVYALAVWIACLGVLPLAWHLLSRAGVALAGLTAQAGNRFRATAAALVPLGMACWIAFALATVLSMLTFVLQSLSDPFNWGWNLLGMAGSRWRIHGSPVIPWLQTACVLAGCAYALRALYGALSQEETTRRRATLASLPQGAFLWAASAGMIWFFAG